MRVSGEGPDDADVFLLGEYPGQTEIDFGRPFIGKTGEELNRFLNGYTAPSREDVYLSNMMHELPLSKGQFKMTEDDEAELWAELEAVAPRVLVTLGAHVLRYFVGEDATLEMHHGIPHRTTHAGLSRIGVEWVFPTYNPAATFHAPQLQAWFAYDMRRLGLFLKGKLPPHVEDRYPGIYRELTHDRPELYSIGPRLASDTEGWIHDPYCFSFSDVPGYGFVVKQAHAGPFIAAVRHARPRLTFHNSLHDLGVYRALGLDVDEAELEFDDTMIMAYLLGLEPQGLKPLAFRHAGMTMSEYAEITEVPGAAKAERWLAELAERFRVKPAKVKHPRRKKGDPPRPPEPVHTDEDKEEFHVRGLIEKMLAKNEPLTLRKRWAACRAREILTEDMGVLQEWEADPPEPTLDEVDADIAVNYAGRDSDGTCRIFPPLDRQIDAMELRDVYETDIGIVPMIDRMQHIGLQCDLDHFKAVSDLLAIEEVVNADEIRRVTGRDLNPRSGPQVAEYLFDVLKLDKHPRARELRIKRTESGDRFSTNDKILEALSGLHESIPLIQEGREIRKMKGTYADAIPRLVGRDGRLHPNYRITRAETGRLTAAEPNVLALPKHSARGKMIREGFIPGPGRVYSEWDLAQIEMCVFAHDANDERMIAEILSGVDKHASTAAGIFKRDAEVIYKEYKAEIGLGGNQRFAAKAVNFGILMGITGFGLLDQMHKNGQLDWTLTQCEDVLHGWLDTYKGGADYIEKKHAEARRYGYVRDMFGRLRWLEGVQSYDRYIQSEALRQAQATPIQSGAQGIIKRAMKMLWPILKSFRAQGMWVECLLQVHDALILEHHPEDTAVINEAVLFCLCNAVQLRVPVKASAKTGKHNLGEL